MRTIKQHGLLCCFLFKSLAINIVYNNLRLLDGARTFMIVFLDLEEVDMCRPGTGSYWSSIETETWANIDCSPSLR
jgi:hypothetical protein